MSRYIQSTNQRQNTRKVFLKYKNLSLYSLYIYLSEKQISLQIVLNILKLNIIQLKNKQFYENSIIILNFD